MTREKAILVLDSLSTWLGYERPITEEIIEAIKTLSQPSLPSNVDEAAEEYALDVKARPFGNLVKEAFIAGAKWQKTQMMKDAVEGTVHNFSSNKPHPTVLVDAKGFNQGDKVHVIIVKEG